MSTEQLKTAANTIINLAEQAKTYEQSKQAFLDKIDGLNKDYEAKKLTKEQLDKQVQEMLQGKTRKEELDSYDTYILHLLEQMESQLEEVKKSVGAKPESKLSKMMSSKEEYKHMNAKLKKKYLQELDIDPQLVKQFLKRKKEGELAAIEKDYEAYTPNEYGKISNKYVWRLTDYAMKKKELQPYLKKLFDDLKASGFKILSKTYVSMIIFTAIISAIAIALVASAFFRHPFIPLQIFRGLLIGVVGGIAAGAAMYIYPGNVAGSKRSAMKAELPFVLIHMSAVAGSGAKPSAMFQTLLTSKDYPALSTDIKKIVNYVNVFGYDLSTALRIVAMTTPSPEFKDMLNGMINTITSGGDMKQFLTSISQDALATYQLQRKKAVEVISTYSDIYTAILIAAPLLFFVTIAIIQMLGGKLAGLSADVIATIGVYGVIPVLNIGYLIFISAVQPK